eukprot:6478750-Amphidinium_carterae.1
MEPSVADLRQAWQNAMKSHHRQLDAARKLLDTLWLVPLPLIEEQQLADVDGVQWSEAFVVAMVFDKAPGEPVNQVILCVPGAAGGGIEESVDFQSAPVYGLGDAYSEDSMDVVQVGLIAMTPEVLGSLCDGCPVGQEVMRFSAFFPGSHPSSVELFEGLANLVDSEACVVLVLQYGTNGERSVAVLGDAEEQGYHSAVEMNATEAASALALVPATSVHQSATGRERPPMAPGTPLGGVGRGRGSMSRQEAADELGRLPISARESEAAAPGLGSGTALPKRKTAPKAKSIPARPAGVESGAHRRKGAKGVVPEESTNEVLKVLQGMQERMMQLEQKLGSGNGPAGSTLPLQGVSLLDQGRVPGPGGAGAGPAGQRAYASTLQQARSLLGAPPINSTPPVEPAVQQGRPRVSDETLREAVARGGDSAQLAIQLGILEALERLQSGGQKGKHPETLEEWLYSAPGVEGSEDQATLGGHIRGAHHLLRLQQSQAAHPRQWALMAESSAQRHLGADTAGLPWNMRLYGERTLHFSPKQEGPRAAAHVGHAECDARSVQGAKLGSSRATACAKPEGGRAGYPAKFLEAS